MQLYTPISLGADAEEKAGEYFNLADGNSNIETLFPENQYIQVSGSYSLKDVGEGVIYRDPLNPESLDHVVAIYSNNKGEITVLSGEKAAFAICAKQGDEIILTGAGLEPGQAFCTADEICKTKFLSGGFFAHQLQHAWHLPHHCSGSPSHTPSQIIMNPLAQKEIDPAQLFKETAGLPYTDLITRVNLSGGHAR